MGFRNARYSVFFFVGANGPAGASKGVAVGFGERESSEDPGPPDLNLVRDYYVPNMVIHGCCKWAFTLTLLLITRAVHHTPRT